MDGILFDAFIFLCAVVLGGCHLLASFDTDEDWLLGPGDVLYLPPGVAHWGTAHGDCMTYSLGFRAPDRRELIAGWSQYVAAHADDARLTDRERAPSGPMGTITADITAEAQRLVFDADQACRPAFADWLGALLTEPKPQFQIDPPDSPWSASALWDWLDDGQALRRHPWARLASATTAAAAVSLYCCGQVLPFDAAQRGVVELVCTRRLLEHDRLARFGRDAAEPVLLALLNLGVLEPESRP